MEILDASEVIESLGLPCHRELAILEDVIGKSTGWNLEK